MGERSRSEEMGKALAGLRTMREGEESRRGSDSFVGDASLSLLNARAQSFSDPIPQLCSDSTWRSIVTSKWSSGSLPAFASSSLASLSLDALTPSDRRSLTDSSSSSANSSAPSQTCDVVARKLCRCVLRSESVRRRAGEASVSGETGKERLGAGVVMGEEGGVMRPAEERRAFNAFLCSASVTPLRRKGAKVVGELWRVDESDGALLDLAPSFPFSPLTLLFFSLDVPPSFGPGRILADVLSPVDVDDFLLLAPTTTLPNTSLFSSPSSSRSSPGIAKIASRFSLAFFLGGEHAGLAFPSVLRTCRSPDRFFFCATRA